MVRCNSCVYIDEQQHKHGQATTFAMVMTPTLTVQILCPNRNATKDIHIDTLWKRHNKHRFWGRNVHNM